MSLGASGGEFDVTRLKDGAYTVTDQWTWFLPPRLEFVEYARLKEQYP